MVITKPNIAIDNIELPVDSQHQQGADTLLKQLGVNMPVVQIGKYILGLGDLLAFELINRLNSFPKFTMTIKDDLYHIREALKQDIDTCTIFIGYKHWYIKFNGVLNTTYTETGDSEIFVQGIVFDKKLFEYNQQSFVDTPPVDMLKSICVNTGLGLNTDTNKILHGNKKSYVQPGVRYIDAIGDIISKHTTNLFCIDWFYYLHVVDIETLRKQKTAKYTLNIIDGKQLSEAPIIFKTVSRVVTDYANSEITGAESIDRKIPVAAYTINTNYTQQHISTANEYTINNKSIHKSELGIGKQSSNTFSGFIDSKNDNYTDIVNKSMAGTIITLLLDFIVIELIPFSIVELEMYLPTDGERKDLLDTEHSGQKIIIGNTIRYTRQGTDTVKFNQVLELI